MKPFIVVSIVAGIVLTILHLASLKNVSDWPVFSQLGLVEWLGGAPWISSVTLMAMPCSRSGCSGASASASRRPARRTCKEVTP